LPVSVLSKRRQERMLILEQEVERLNHIIAALNDQLKATSYELQGFKDHVNLLQDQIMGT
jgi:uncharacterized coiled-coil protein SlyX